MMNFWPALICDGHLEIRDPKHEANSKLKAQMTKTSQMLENFGILNLFRVADFVLRSLFAADWN
jgi:hypothetical protein